MEVRMEHTEGLGRSAEVWADGHLLNVCDGVSTADRRVAPGVIEGVRFSYVSVEAFSWDQAVRENPGKKKHLEPLHGWSYVGWGQIAAIIPVIIDFGVLKMEDANWTSDNRLIGRHVKIQIDRLEIHFARKTD